MIKMITLGNEFCYWDCRCFGDLVIMVFNALVAVSLTLYCCNIYKMSKTIPENQQHSLIYIILMLWGFTCISSNVYSVVVYLIINQQEQREIISTHSRVFAVLVSLPFIFIMFLLTYIPYTMMRNICDILNNRDMHLSKKESNFSLCLVKYYVRIKPLIVIVPLIFLLVPDDDPRYYVDVADIRLLCFIGDSLLDGIILICCRQFMVRQLEKLQFQSNEDRLKLIRQVSLLAFSSFCRFTGYLYLGVYARNMLAPQEDRFYVETRCLEPMKQHFMYSFTYLMLATWLVNFVPVIVAARMYHPGAKGMKVISSGIEEN